MSLSSSLNKEYRLTDECKSQIATWEAIVGQVFKSGGKVSDKVWATEIATILEICKVGSAILSAKSLTSQDRKHFAEIINKWRSKFIMAEVETHHEETSDSLAAAICKNLNLSAAARPSLEVMEKIWEKSIADGESSETILEEVRNKCRNLSGKGFYDPKMKLESIVNRWAGRVMVRDHDIPPVIRDVVAFCLC